MKFIIEDIGDRFDELESILQKRNLWYKTVKHIPFSLTWDISLPNKDYSSYFPLCSVNTMLLAKDIGMQVYFTESNYDYTKFAKEYDEDFINHDLKTFRFGDLPQMEKESSNYLTKQIYIRDAYGDNLIKGRVHSYMELTTKYTEYLGRSLGKKKIDDDYVMCYSTPKTIVSEYRFFVVNRKIVTASQYNSEGLYWIRNIDMMYNTEFDEHFKFVERMINKYSPDDSFVIDICKLEDGSMKVVECNCINCSGFYAIDLELLIDNLLDIK
jgi:hypothetical protein